MSLGQLWACTKWRGLKGIRCSRAARAGSGSLQQPCALVAWLQCDDDTSVAAMWGEVWEESTTSAGGGLRLHIKEIAQVREQGGRGWWAVDGTF